MIFLRSLAYNTALGIVTFFFALYILLAWPFRSRDHLQEIGRKWSGVNRKLLSVLCGITDRVEGLEHLPPPPFVILSKHQSAWETVVFPTLFPRFVWVLKSSLLYIPFFGWALAAMGEIAINRSRATEALRQLMRHGLLHLKEGTCIVIFPEGTRKAPGEVGLYNPGGAILAADAAVPIVPIAHNAGELWGRRSFLKHPGVVHVRIGPAIHTTNLDRAGRKILIAQVQQSIEGMMAEIGKKTESES